MQVLLIGIDGLDSNLLSKWEAELPNFKMLKEKGISFKMTPVYPIDSVPIWASIYTGLTPATHGIIQYMDYFKKKGHEEEINLSQLRGRTFWDIAGKFNKKVCIINPFLAYPSWQVNGVMISGPVGANKPPTAFPNSILEKYRIPHLGGIRTEFPVTEKDLSEFRNKLEEITLDETEFGLKILNDCDWDLAFLNLITLDGIEHSFWRYCDHRDPTYPGKNPFEDVIKNFYKLHDHIIGMFLKSYPNAHMIVVSDHGHCMRSIKLVNVNEFLRKRALLISNEKNFKITTLVEKIKPKLLTFIYKYELYGLALKITRAIPSASKKVQKSEYSINANESIAITSDFTGMNPFGGIIINSLNDIDNYEELRALIISELLKLEDPETAERLVKWACRREELYEGKYISKYPDVLFEFKRNYGVNWAIHTPIVDINYAHKLVSGGHSSDATLLIYGIKNRKIINTAATSTDVAPTVLDILGIDCQFGFDGAPLFSSY